ncbi:MAG: hypothetical protein BGP01_12930 [Paludibacter sp. 47-17]|nr:MAG: hypothetical protein BGP01_12930 [Paludibacter sp. 47-17]
MQDTAIHTIIRFSGKGIPDYFHREDWVAAVLYLLFMLLVVACVSSRQLFFKRFTDLFKSPLKKEFHSKTTFSDYVSYLSLMLITITVISLIACTSLTRKPGIDFSEFSSIWLITLGFIVLKYLSMRLLGYIFLTPEKTRLGIRVYFNMLAVSGLIFYPLLVLKIYSINSFYASIIDTGMLCIALIIIALTTMKIFQIFYQKIFDIVYIMLYLCTLEFLPLSGIFQVYNIFIRNFNF